jgi:hypothetical protein
MGVTRKTWKPRRAKLMLTWCFYGAVYFLVGSSSSSANSASGSSSINISSRGISSSSSGTTSGDSSGNAASNIAPLASGARESTTIWLAKQMHTTTAIHTRRSVADIMMLVQESADGSAMMRDSRKLSAHVMSAGQLIFPSGVTKLARRVTLDAAAWEVLRQERYLELQQRLRTGAARHAETAAASLLVDALAPVISAPALQPGARLQLPSLTVTGLSSASAARGSSSVVLEPVSRQQVADSAAAAAAAVEVEERRRRDRERKRESRARQAAAAASEDPNAPQPKKRKSKFT